MTFLRISSKKIKTHIVREIWSTKIWQPGMRQKERYQRKWKRSHCQRNNQRKFSRVEKEYKPSNCAQHRKWTKTHTKTQISLWNFRMPQMKRNFLKSSQRGMRIRFASDIYSATLNIRKQCFNTFQNLRGNYFQSRNL